MTRIGAGAVALLVAQALWISRALAATDADYRNCAGLPDDQRLKCYDDVDADKNGRTYLDRHWKLRDENINITDVQPHRPTYVLVGKWTNHVNTQPSSPLADHTVPAPIPYNNDELAFQLSFKSQLMQRHNFDPNFSGFANMRLWFAYTQQSFWQLYNPRLSRPFRETNYEPEAILTFARDNPDDGWKLLNLGLVHQSNGRSLPQSRSWNRVYAEGGWEWGRLSVLGRGWYRIPESSEKDDNPDIQDYLGRGDVQLRWQFDNDKSMSLLLRHSFRTGRGFAQLDWTSRKLVGAARVYVQATSGYGESLIDYNFRQNTFGIGFAYGS